MRPARVYLLSAAVSPGLALCVALALRLGAAPAETHEAYVESIPGLNLSIEMAPIPEGRFRIGSPPTEPGREPDEGPGPEVAVAPFWMSRYEVQWDVYDAFRLDKRLAAPNGQPPLPNGIDGLTRPTPPYGDESFGFGKQGQPVIGITHHAAMEFTRWLSAVTGRAYRLPTEAEWEYACRGGRQSAYSFGPDPAALAAHAWYEENSDFRPRPVGRREPNVWGLFDMHGNVAEWVLDRYASEAWKEIEPGADSPVTAPEGDRYPHVVRGGSWQDGAAELRCAARRASEHGWSRRDPQQPQSIWWHTDATFVGFRIVRAKAEPDPLAALRSKVSRESQ